MREPAPVLVADDNEDDWFLIERAFAKNRIANPSYWVKDGDELLDFLLQRGDYSDPEQAPRPGLVLLDLNMPGKDGRAALQEIREHPDLRHLPVVALTASGERREVIEAYELGVNSFLVKPDTFDQLSELVRCLNRYWFEAVQLPPEE
ncbi:MAG: response regulator [Elainellaceae cyanobacterium]